MGEYDIDIIKSLMLEIFTKSTDDDIKSIMIGTISYNIEDPDNLVIYYTTKNSTEISYANERKETPIRYRIVISHKRYIKKLREKRLNKILGT